MWERNNYTCFSCNCNPSYIRLPSTISGASCIVAYSVLAVTAKRRKTLSNFYWVKRLLEISSSRTSVRHCEVAQSHEVQNYRATSIRYSNILKSCWGARVSDKDWNRYSRLSETVIRSSSWVDWSGISNRHRQRYTVSSYLDVWGVVRHDVDLWRLGSIHWNEGLRSSFDRVCINCS
jgi:hypothetical protein